MAIKKYVKTVTSSNEMEFDEAIQYWLNEGYKPLGQTSTCPGYNATPTPCTVFTLTLTLIKTDLNVQEDNN